MIVRSRRYKGGSSYELTVSPEQLIERPPLPGEEIALGEMGRVRVMSANDARPAAGWTTPGERLWRLVVQTRDIGPEFDDL